MQWDEFNGWTGKYVMKLAGVFNFVKEADVLTSPQYSYLVE